MSGGGGMANIKLVTMDPSKMSEDNKYLNYNQTLYGDYTDMGETYSMYIVILISGNIWFYSAAYYSKYALTNGKLLYMSTNNNILLYDGNTSQQSKYGRLYISTNNNLIRFYYEKLGMGVFIKNDDPLYALCIGL